MKTETPAQIAKKNNWIVGTKLQATELKRFDRYYVITAIGMNLVLGIATDRTKISEFPLALDDDFITWSKLED